MGHETLVRYVDPLIPNPREEILEEIFTSDSPLDKLDEIAAASPKYLRKGEESYLLGRISGDDKNAEADLYWYSLQTINTVIGRFRGKGLEDADVLAISFAETKELFNEYREKEETFPHFKMALHQSIQRRLSEETAKIYGLVPKDMALIDNYFSSVKTFNDLYGRDPQENELQELINLELESEDLAREGSEPEEHSLTKTNNIKKFEHIHDVHFEGDIYFEDSEMLLEEETTEEKQEEKELTKAVDEQLADISKVSLSPVGAVSEYEVLAYRYGFRPADAEKHTLEELAYKLGVTTERIRQVEATALSKLRSPKKVRQLRDYLVDADASRSITGLPRTSRQNAISVSGNDLVFDPLLSGQKASEKKRSPGPENHIFRKEDLLKRNWNAQIFLEYLRLTSNEKAETLDVSGLPEVIELPDKWHDVFAEIRSSSEKGEILNAVVASSLTTQLPVITTYPTSMMLDGLDAREQADVIRQASKPFYLDHRAGDIISPRPGTLPNDAGFEDNIVEPVGVRFEQLYRFLAQYSNQQFTMKLDRGWNIMLLRGRDSKLLDPYGDYSNRRVVLTAWQELLKDQHRLLKVNKHLSLPGSHNFAIYAGLPGNELKRLG